MSLSFVTINTVRMAAKFNIPLLFLMRFNFDKTDFNEKVRCLQPHVYLLVLLSIMSGILISLPLLYCEFGPIDVPRFLVNKSGGNSTQNEFTALISDIYYQHLDEYLEGTSRFIFLLPRVKVDYTSISITYRHGVSDDTKSLNSMGGATYQTSRGVKLVGTQPLVEFLQSQSSNANFSFLLKSGIDIFDYNGYLLHTLTDKLITHKGLRFGFILSFALAVVALTCHAYFENSVTRVVLIASLVLMVIFNLAMMASGISIHFTAKLLLLAADTVVTVVHIIILVASILMLYCCSDSSSFREESRTTQRDADSQANLRPKLSTTEMQNEAPPRSGSNLTLGSGSKLAEIKMINSSSSEEKKLESASSGSKRSRGYAISNSHGFDASLQRPQEGSLNDSNLAIQGGSGGNEGTNRNSPQETLLLRYSELPSDKLSKGGMPIIKYKSLTDLKSTLETSANTTSIPSEQPLSGSDSLGFHFNAVLTRQNSSPEILGPSEKAQMPEKASNVSNLQEDVIIESPEEAHESRVHDRKSIPTNLSSFEMGNPPRRSRSLFKEED